MKEIQEDFASFELTFTKGHALAALRARNKRPEWIRKNESERIERYLYEKPYLVEALRRNDN